jgi:4-hydroxy-tetrahydrodipicolinate synthase
MLTRETMKGLYALAITPFASAGELDEIAYRENVRLLLTHGVDGVITCGTNGEFHTTTDEERRRIAQIVVEETRGRAVAVAGASGVNTAESIARTRDALDAGADAVMNVIPFYHVLSRGEAHQYFEDLSRACPEIGIIIYNNPVTTQVRLDDGDFVRLQEIPNICGVKMIGADFALYLNCIRRTSIQHFPLENLWGISAEVGGEWRDGEFLVRLSELHDALVEKHFGW